MDFFCLIHLISFICFTFTSIISLIWNKICKPQCCMRKKAKAHNRRGPKMLIKPRYKWRELCPNCLEKTILFYVGIVIWGEGRRTSGIVSNSLYCLNRGALKGWQRFCLRCILWWLGLQTSSQLTAASVTVTAEWGACYGKSSLGFLALLCPGPKAVLAIKKQCVETLQK